METFDGIREGASVYSITRGRGRVMLILDEEKFPYFIDVLFDSGSEAAFNRDGIANRFQIHRELYHGDTHPIIKYL